jgi:hypothetical protein
MNKNFVVVDFFPEVSNIGETEESRLKEFFLKHLMSLCKVLYPEITKKIPLEYIEIDRENQQMKLDICCFYTTFEGPKYDVYEYKFDETSEDEQILLITESPIQYAD